MGKKNLKEKGLEDALIGRICRRVVDRKKGLFSHWPEYGAEDLYQECLIAVRVAAKGFDARKGAPSTFIYLVASRRLIDVWRRRARLAEGEGQGARKSLQVEEGYASGARLGELEWLALMRRKAEALGSVEQARRAALALWALRRGAPAKGGAVERLQTGDVQRALHMRKRYTTRECRLWILPIMRQVMASGAQ